MRLTIFRGTHEIGGSCVELKSGDTRIILDLGIPLYDRHGSRLGTKIGYSSTRESLLEDGTLPDVRGLYTHDEFASEVAAVFLSHAHMDHSGLIHFIQQSIPIYAGEATHQLLKLNTIFSAQACGGTQKIFESGRPCRIRNFTITPFLVDHSAFDAYSFLIEADGKRVYYSGDFRGHGRKPKTLNRIIRALSGKRIDAMLLEGTVFGRNAVSAITEDEIESIISHILGESLSLTLVCVSAQNIDRLVSIYRAALRNQRIMVVDVYTAIVLNKLKEYARIPFPHEKFPGLRVYFPYFLCQRLIKNGHARLVYRFKKYKITREEIMERQNNVIMTVRSSMLSDLKKMSISPGANFIYSMWKGYKNETTMKALLKYADEQGMAKHDIHSSGHADPELLIRFVHALKPTLIIPIHTFNPGLYKKIWDNVLLLHDIEEVEV